MAAAFFTPQNLYYILPNEPATPYYTAAVFPNTILNV